MRGVNKVFLLGNLGNDPDVRYTQGGMAIVTLSLATTSYRKDKDGGGQTEKVEWHRVKAFGKLGELCGEYLSKGSAAFVEGRIEYGSYEKDGVKHYTTDVIADDVQFLAAGAGGGESRGGGGGRSSAPARGGGRASSERVPAEREASQRTPAAGIPDPFVDDDIPF